MPAEIAAFLDQWHADRNSITEYAPNLAGNFGTFHQAIMKEVALSVREKELIGLAQRCGPCIQLHVHGGLKSGAVPEQILGAASGAVVMQGGPAFTHVPEVIAVLEGLQDRSAR